MNKPEDELPALLEALGEAQPKYFTKPTPGAVNDLAAARVVAQALGTPLFPWQALTIRIASERRHDDPRRYRWPLVIITTPRQVGKTTMYRIYQVTKCLMQPGRIAYFTAQTGKDARARWNDIVKALVAEKSPLKNAVSIRYSAGDAQVKFRNGSIIAPFAPTAESLHGYTPHDVAVDEAFAFDSVQGTDLMGAIVPAQQRLPDRQLLIFSTAGNAESGWLRELIDQGRAALDDPGAPVAFLEWSMADGADPDDPANWLFHPGITGDFTLEDLTDQYKQMRDRPGEWLRAYMNTWQDVDNSVKVFTPEEISLFKGYEQTPPEKFSDLCISYEMAADRSRAVIAAAWVDPVTKLPNIRIAQRLGYGEDLAAAMLDVIRQRPKTYGADDGGATRDTTDQLEQKHKTPRILNGKESATAAEAFIARAKAGEISLHVDEFTEQALDDLATRPVGQGINFDRKKSRGPIPEIIAAAVALRLLEENRDSNKKPIIWSF